MRVLIVKTSSMGDVVHALPALSDLCAARPGVQVDWLVEAAFSPIPARHPGVRTVWPMRWRAWRRRLWQPAVWREMAALRRGLRAQPYDLVIDLQGLLKSALWAAQAHGPRAGYDRASIREPLAVALYQHTAAVSRELQAIERCRRLMAAHLGYAMPESAPRFGLRAGVPTWRPAGAFAALVPMASRPEKLWPEADWIALGQALRAQGLAVAVLWGSADEGERASRIAQAVGGERPPRLSVGDAMDLLGAARLVVGLDTGFTHMAAAMGVATVGIYADHDPALAGVTGDGFCASLGGVGRPPTRAQVGEAVGRALAAQDSSSSVRGG